MNSLSLDRRQLLAGAAAMLGPALLGCPKTPNAEPGKVSTATEKRPLILLVADDPDLGKAIAREWRGRTEEELVVRNVALAELTAAARLPGDVVIFATGLIGQLAERGLIVPLGANALEDADFNLRDIFDLVRQREMRWGGQTFAAPLGSPQLLLCYRADIFEKVGSEPPADWAAYQAAVERLVPDERVEGWRAAIEPLAAGWAGQMLLARAAGYAMHRDQVSPLFRFDSMEPLIDQPPYVRALEELVAAANADGAEPARKTPQEAFAALTSGECAMAIAWAATAEPNQQKTETAGRLAFALLPGSQQAYRFATKSWEGRGDDEQGPIPLLSVSGRVAAVTASASDAGRAGGFALWLAGREISQQWASLSENVTLFRQSQVAASGRWTPSLAPESSRQYAQTLATSLNSPRAFPGLTLPGRGGYLGELDEAVAAALAGRPAAEALTDAAGRWREITEKLGLEAQRRANGRSLGKG